MKSQKMLCLALSFLLLAVPCVVFAVKAPDSVVGYFKEDVSFKGDASVTGTIIVEEGDAEFSPNMQLFNDGKLIKGSSVKLKPSKLGEQLTNYIETQDYELSMPDVPESDSPKLDNKDSLKIQGKTVEVSQSGHYKSVILEWDKPILQVNAPVGETIIIRIDKLSAVNSAEIVINGECNVIFYLGEDCKLNNLVINAKGSADQCTIYFEHEDNLNLNNICINGKMYMPEVEKLTLGGNNQAITNGYDYAGAIYCNGDIKISSGIKVNGFVYTPDGTLSMVGNSAIYGVAAAESLEMTGSSKLVYQPISNSILDGIIKGQEKPEEPEVTPTPTRTQEPGATPTPTPTVTPTPEPDESTEITPAPVPTPVGPEIDLNCDYAYFFGYDDTLAAARKNLKRQEVCAFLYRLMKQDSKTGGFTTPQTPSYADLPSNDWSYAAIEYMRSVGAFSKEAYKINPTGDITRGEVAKIVTFALRLKPDDSKSVNFDDLSPNHPYYYYMKAMADKGYFMGNNDGTVTPDSPILRGEFVSILNRIIGRDGRYSLEGVKNPYKDLREDDWDYEDIIRASYGFTDFVVDPEKTASREIDF